MYVIKEHTTRIWLTLIIVIPYLPLLIFHSSLILWTYSSLLNTTCNFDLKEIITTSLETNIGTSVVLLNDDWSQETDRFVELNDNIPCLRTKKYNGTVTSKGITKELIFLCVPEDIIDYSIQINSEISCGLLSNHINDLLKSLRSCNNGIILSWYNTWVLLYTSHNFKNLWCTTKTYLLSSWYVIYLSFFNSFLKLLLVILINAYFGWL